MQVAPSGISHFRHLGGNNIMIILPVSTTTDHSPPGSSGGSIVRTSFIFFTNEMANDGTPIALKYASMFLKLTNL